MCATRSRPASSQGPRIACGAYALMTTVGGTAGRLIPDHGAIGWGKVLKDKDEIVAEVRRQIKIGADWIKVHVTGLIPRQKHKGELSVWMPDELKLLCDVAHDLGTPVVGHCRGASSVRDAANAGFDLIYHATGMDDEALAAVIDRRVPIAPTLTFQANMADFGEVVGADQGLRDHFRSEITDSVESLRRAYDAGVPLLCGSESGFSMVPYGQWHYREMEVFTKYLGSDGAAGDSVRDPGRRDRHTHGREDRRDRARLSRRRHLRRRRSVEGSDDPGRSGSHQARHDRWPNDGYLSAGLSASPSRVGAMRRWAVS